MMFRSTISYCESAKSNSSLPLQPPSSSPSSSPSSEKDPELPCTPCKLVSLAAFSSCSAYMGYLGLFYHKKKSDRIFCLGASLGK